MTPQKNSQQTHWNFLKRILVAVVTKIWEFWHKISYNSDHTWAMAKHYESEVGVRGRVI